MYYIAQVNAYDALSNVVVAAEVKATAGGLGDPISQVFHLVECVPGVGEDDPGQWLKDALVALIEAL